MSAAAPPASATDPSAPTPLGLAGFVLTRLVVPLWILAGAGVKMVEAAPSYLPKNAILVPARAVGFDLQWLLAGLISIEFIVAFTILLVPRLARSLAAFMLAAFCLVLVYEMMKSADSCGCFGSNSPPPAAMLTIDGLMLAGVLLLRPWPERLLPTAARWGGVAVLSLAGVIATGAFVRPGAAVIRDGGPGTPAADWTPDPLPPWWFSENLEQWVGRPWTDFPLVRFMPARPGVSDEGVHYVMFYSRTCDHCQEVFQDLLVDPEFGGRTTAIEVPAGKARLRDEGAAWPLPETDAELLSLPLGPDWIITTPLDIRVENGLITEITEGHDDAWVDPHGPVWGPPVIGGAGAAAAVPPAAGAPAIETPAVGPAVAPAPSPRAAVATTPRRNPSPAALRPWWFSENLESWVGRPWAEFDLFTFMPTWPTVPETGVRYVVFYGRTCDHCEEMFLEDLVDPDLAARTTAIEIPVSKTRMRDEGAAWPMPTTSVELLDLPIGPDWIVTTPLTLRIEDGVITAIEEGEHKGVMGLD